MISGQFDLIQVGVTAMKDPVTGDYQTPLPLYVIADPVSIAQEESLIRDFAQIAGEKFRQYMAAQRAEAAEA